ncbi:hypothetical protein BOO71_0000658 [Deinococcus marmoris]|uniref:Uncharacterized protein n=1 Tax=Deinococcus marmoris TaxID=249408 RepID=A0A1U7P4X8_9DEIO|nr:hypothetical protein BOO71_0000658 [Deinococcus marmoris]
MHLDGCNDLQNARSSDAAFGGEPVFPGFCKPDLVPSSASASYPGVLTVGSAKQDEDTKAVGTWHWPERA